MLELFAVLHLGGHDRALASLRSSHKCVARGFGATAVRYKCVGVGALEHHAAWPGSGLAMPKLWKC